MAMMMPKCSMQTAPMLSNNIMMAGAMPFAGKHKFTGSDTGIECVMVDSNGTEYRTLDWFAVYKASGDDDDYDGMVDDGEGKIKYELTCLNAQQQ